MQPLKYTMVSLTTRGTSIYIHEEKQTYKFQRKTSIKETYKCMVNSCNAKIMKIDHDCFRNIPHVDHNHSQNDAKIFRKKIQRVFALRVMERMFKIEGEIDIKKAKKIIFEKAGKMEYSVLWSLKRRFTHKIKEKNTGIFITVEPVHLIPLDKIVNIERS